MQLHLGLILPVCPAQNEMLNRPQRTSNISYVCTWWLFDILTQTCK